MIRTELSQNADHILNFVEGTHANTRMDWNKAANHPIMNECKADPNYVVRMVCLEECVRSRDMNE